MLFYILISFCLFFSFLNLIFTINLSNALFRIFSTNISSKKVEAPKQSDSGLVDPKAVPTYDPRFRNV